MKHCVYSHQCGRLGVLHSARCAEHHNIDATARVGELGHAADRELREIALTRRRQVPRGGNAAREQAGQAKRLADAAQSTTKHACRYKQLVTVLYALRKSERTNIL